MYKHKRKDTNKMYRYVKSAELRTQSNLKADMKAIQDDVLNAASDYLKNEFGWDFNLP